MLPVKSAVQLPIEVPILRAGQCYFSQDRLDLTDYATGQVIARVSQANPGLISRDLRQDPWPDLQEIPIARMLEILREAGRHFVHGTLPVGEQEQSPEDFIAMQSATTGLPQALCKANMAKVEASFVNMAAILDGLTGGLDLATIDAGYGQRDGHVISYAPRARRFGAVLPANSPGVHALWLPALALKMPVALRPGQREPWTPLRILEALREAGYPSEGFGFYPSGHDGAGVILRKCGASMMFGSGSSVKPWLGNPAIEIHGPGFSKVLLGPDRAPAWKEYLDLIATSVAANGGRSCINCSSVRTTSHGRELGIGLAEKMATIVPRSRDDAQATLAAFADPNIAIGINASIERGLAQGGAEDLSAPFRAASNEQGRLVQFEGGTYLLPTVIYCTDPEHPLANQEYLFPFASIVESPADEIVEQLGPSLVVTALTEDRAIRRELLARCDIGRLNLGPVPTVVLQWDQPHEGNLFTHLFQQRAFQQESFALAH